MKVKFNDKIIRVSFETHRMLKVLASRVGKSMRDVVGDLVIVSLNYLDEGRRNAKDSKECDKEAG